MPPIMHSSAKQIKGVAATEIYQPRLCLPSASGDVCGLCALSHSCQRSTLRSSLSPESEFPRVLAPPQLL